MKRSVAIVAVVLATALAAVGCQQMMQALEESTTEDTVLGKSVRGVNRARKAFTDLDPSEEHYVGRAVAAQILSEPRYVVSDDQALQDYVNLVGQAIVTGCDEVRHTFDGYSFAVLETDEVNAFAAPGGTILLTRGMLRQTASEDELAAVLAHEIGHVTHRHGLAAIQQANLTEAFLYLGTAAAQATMSEQDLQKLTEVFDSSVQDVVKTLVVNGYSREAETEADGAAVRYLTAAGYDPEALQRVLQRMAGTGGDGGFFATHPAPSDRMADAKPTSKPVDAAVVAQRTARYRSVVKAE